MGNNIDPQVHYRVEKSRWGSRIPIQLIKIGSVTIYVSYLKQKFKLKQTHIYINSRGVKIMGRCVKIMGGAGGGRTKKASDHDVLKHISKMQGFDHRTPQSSPLDFNRCVKFWIDNPP